MAPLQSRSVDDLIVELAKRVERLQGALARGPILPSYTSATLPTNPPTGLEVLVTDLGLRAWWNGSSWVYPPQQITKRVLTAPASSVRLPASGSIPQVFTNLRLVISAQSDSTGANGFDSANLQVNGVTSASYNWSTIWVIQGGAVSTTGGTSQTSMQCAEIWNAHFGTPARGIATIEIPNYADAAGMKSFTSSAQASDGGAAGIQQIYSGTLSGTTAAVTALTMLMGTGNFVAGSEFSLYGS